LLSISVEDFVAYFELACGEHGLGRGLKAVRAALASADASRTPKELWTREGSVERDTPVAGLTSPGSKVEATDGSRSAVGELFVAAKASCGHARGTNGGGQK